MARVVSIVIKSVVGAALLLLLWSARYRYDHITVDSDSYLVRIDRLSGHADILVPEEGWVPAEESWSQSQDETPDNRT